MFPRKKYTVGTDINAVVRLHFNKITSILMLFMKGFLKVYGF